MTGCVGVPRASSSKKEGTNVPESQISAESVVARFRQLMEESAQSVEVEIVGANVGGKVVAESATFTATPNEQDGTVTFAVLSRRTGWVATTTSIGDGRCRPPASLRAACDPPSAIGSTRRLATRGRGSGGSCSGWQAPTALGCPSSADTAVTWSSSSTTQSRSACATVRRRANRIRCAAPGSARRRAEPTLCWPVTSPVEDAEGSAMPRTRRAERNRAGGRNPRSGDSHP
jgi:hypothetical protein